MQDRAARGCAKGVSQVTCILLDPSRVCTASPAHGPLFALAITQDAQAMQRRGADAGLRSQLILACRMPQIRHQAAHEDGQNGMNGADASESDIATSAQNNTTTLRGRLAGVDIGIRPLNPQPNAIVR